MLRTLSTRAVAVAPLARGIQTAKLPDLPYDFGALQPVISGEIMQARRVARPRGPGLAEPDPDARRFTTASTMPLT